MARSGASRPPLPDHVFDHILTMAQLHADNRYDRLTHDVEAITGRPATSIREYVAQHPEIFGSSRHAPRPRVLSDGRLAVRLPFVTGYQPIGKIGQRRHWRL